MSTQNFHQGIFSFSNGYDRSTMKKHMAKVQVFEPLPPVPQQMEVSGELPLYETSGTLSEMFNFGLENHQIPSNYRWSQKLQPPQAALNETEVGALGEEKYSNQYDCNDANLANPMQLWTMNSHVKPFSSPVIPPSSALQMLFSNPPNSHDSPVQFTWLPGSTSEDAAHSNKIGGALESQGLSLSLSSPFEELRVGNGGVFISNQGVLGASFDPYGSKNLGTDRQLLHTEGILEGHGQVHVGFGTSFVRGNFLRNSKYLKAAQELLEEICCVGRGQFKDHRVKKQPINPNSNTDSDTGVASSSLQEHPSLSAVDKTEYQRRKVKLLSMLEEVDGRYRHYCEQMQTMVNSFDAVMGFGGAMTYTALAQKAMSRHFRGIKNAIAAQLKATCELLGEKDVAGIPGLTKGETPRLRLLEQSLRQQKAFHHMGMMELEAWRPQRGLPERSVNILRAWLFEHFLHPYPSDADKHLLSRQTGLSKNQVSNWFINARVRLWKPMVEEMYQKEAKEEPDNAAKEEANSSEPNSLDDPNSLSVSAQTPMHGTATITKAPPGKRSSINATEKDPSKNTINYRPYSLGNQIMIQDTATTATAISSATAIHDIYRHESIADFEKISAGANMATSFVRHGIPAGDVSLTLGLRHTGNVPEKSQSHLSVRNFGAC